MRSIDGCLYMNDGDWVEHGTALAESLDGSLQILDWRQRCVVAEVETSESTMVVSTSACTIDAAFDHKRRPGPSR